MFSYDRKSLIVFTALVITMAASNALFAQRDPRIPPEPPADPVIRNVSPAGNFRIHGPYDDETSERSIKVDPNINLSLCVNKGRVTVNGWNRNEVRVFVSNGSKFGIKVQYKNPKSGDPSLISIISVPDAKNKNKYVPPNECIYGDEIEIDAPHSAVLNLKGQEISTAVDGIRKASIKNLGGDISASNIAEGVSALTYNGDLTVEQSSGAMILETTRGNILVFDVWPSEIGDIFKAKSNSGAISVQKLAYRQIEVNSISGTVFFNGEILSGGNYAISTNVGSIRLILPTSTACMFSATYASGSFSSDLPFKLATEDVREGSAKTMVGSFNGGGDAQIKLTTNNGSISIKKQP